MSGYKVANATELRSVDVTGDPTPSLRFMVSVNQWYAYDLDGTGTDNGEWIIEPTTGGGNWYPTGQISGTSTPSGVSAYPVFYMQISSGSGGSQVTNIYANPGGGSSTWTSTSLA
jgi:hypothetical protein